MTGMNASGPNYTPLQLWGARLSRQAGKMLNFGFPGGMRWGGNEALPPARTDPRAFIRVTSAANTPTGTLTVTPAVQDGQIVFNKVKNTARLGFNGQRWYTMGETGPNKGRG